MLYRCLKSILVFLFAPSRLQSSCNTIAQLPLPLQYHHLGHGKDPNIIYLFGGWTTSFQTIDSIYKWNVSAPTSFFKISTTTPSLLFISKSNNAVSLNDKIYFVGTDDDDWNSGIVYIFDVITETWLNSANIAKPSYPSIYGCLTANDTHLFLIGGQTDGSTYLKRLQIYDINSNTWSDQEIDVLVGIGWSRGYCDFVNNYLYVFGGNVASDTYQSLIYKWNPTEKWSNIGNLPFAQWNGGTVHHNNNVYIIGGRSVQNEKTVKTSSIYEFDTNKDNITDEYHMTEGLSCIAAGIVSNKLYIFGGDSDDAIDDVQMCDIMQNLTIAPSTSSLTTFDPTASSPTASSPTTSSSTTSSPTTSSPTTSSSTTLDPTTFDPPTSSPPTPSPTTSSPTIPTEIVVNVIICVVFLTVVIGICIYCMSKKLKGKEEVDINASAPDIPLAISPLSEDTKQIQHITELGLDHVKYMKKPTYIDMSYITPIALKRRVHKDALDVQYWLANVIKLPQYFGHFMDSGYESMDFIKEIPNISELLEIGIESIKHQQKIFEEIKKLKGEQMGDMERVSIYSKDMNFTVEGETYETVYV